MKKCAIIQPRPPALLPPTQPGNLTAAAATLLAIARRVAAERQAKDERRAA